MTVNDRAERTYLFDTYGMEKLFDKFDPQPRTQIARPASPKIVLAGNLSPRDQRRWPGMCAVSTGSQQRVENPYVEQKRQNRAEGKI